MKCLKDSQVNIVRFEVLTSVLVMQMQCCVARLVVPDISKTCSGL